MNLGKALLLGAAKGVTVPTAAGEVFGGGFYVGRMKVDSQSYALIVSPKAQGEVSGVNWNFNSSTAGTTSTWDGAANTAAMIAADPTSHQAAAFCKNLTIGGYLDWFLPAKDQLELLYRKLKPGTEANSVGDGVNPNSDPTGTAYTTSNPGQTTAVAFKTGGSEAFEIGSYYWSSTQVSATTASLRGFQSGVSGSDPKRSLFQVRAVRMIKI